MIKRIFGLMSIVVVLACLMVECKSENKNLTEKTAYLVNGLQKPLDICKDKQVKKDMSMNESGNVSNGGYVACQGEWLYFVYYNFDFKLYKMKIDGGEVVKVVDDKASSLVVLNEWIYYSNGSDEGRIYKIRTDGSKRIRLNNDSSSCINIKGDWIYYKNNSDYNRIYRVNVDGSKRTKISDDIAGIINIEGEWIYYNNISRNGLEGDGRLYKIKINGTDKTVVCYDDVGFFNVYNNTIYFTRSLHGFYKIHTDGSDKVELDSESSGVINVTRNYIYYGIDNIQKIGITNDERFVLIRDLEPLSINVVGDWIFYIVHINGDNSEDGECTGEGYNQMYRIKTDGSCNEIFEP